MPNQIPWIVHPLVWKLDHWKCTCFKEQVLSMFLKTVFDIFDLVNIEKFSFQYTLSATIFIVSPNGTHVYRLFISKVLQTSAFCGFMLFIFHKFNNWTDYPLTFFRLSSFSNHFLKLYSGVPIVHKTLEVNSQFSDVWPFQFHV